MGQNEFLPRPKCVATVDELRANVAAARAGGKSIGLVPTMGALHEGHLSLARASKAECGYTVVSIFVNPTQFSPEEDLAAYPRTLAADLDKLATCGTDLVFAPANDEVYAEGHATWVEVGSVARPLEGECRPIHFRGVATVVLKLFNMVSPDFAYFGQKDYQQAQVIKRMVADLNVPTVMRVCPTVRESDGLAMSSRNAYLNPDARRRALTLWNSLCLADELVKGGERSPKIIARRMRDAIESVPDARIDYIAVVDPDTLEPVDTIEGPVLAALAVHIGKTRLIDNRLLEA
jgi:pantoate--beta-alanine ligase